MGSSQADPASGSQPGHASDDLQALADYLSLGRIHLVGVAGGGFVALDYAAFHPERLSSLVVGASTGSVSDKEIQEVIARIEIPGIRTLPAHYREVGADRIVAPIPRERNAGWRSRNGPGSVMLLHSHCGRQIRSPSWPRSRHARSSWRPTPISSRRQVS